MENNQLIPSDISSLYVSRMIVLIESGPQTNKYRQVQLTKDQFITLSDIIYRSLGGDPERNTMVQMPIGDVVIKLPDTLQDFKIK